MSTQDQKDELHQGNVATEEQIEFASGNKELEKKIVRKVDWKLLPPLSLLMMASFIDRVNIGNARLLGLERDLKMHGTQFNTSLLVFFIPYILLEVPANLIMRKLRPSLWLSGIIAVWGVLTICQGLTRSYGGLLACRFLIGVFEAGFFPGAIYLISMYYKRHSLQIRINIFFSASILSGAFSGLLAYGIGHMQGVRGYSAWRWVFIIEGIATVALAVMGYFCIPDWPEQAKFLSTEERAVLLAMVAQDGVSPRIKSLDKKTTLLAFADIKIYLGVLMFLACTITNYSITLFVPTLLHGYGWSPLRTQIMTIPVYIVAAVVCVGLAYASDYTRHRFLYIFGTFIVALVAWIILYFSQHVSIGVRYMAIFLNGVVATTQPIAVVWLNNNMGSDLKRGIASGLQIGLGNFGGIIASSIFLNREAPVYHTGFSVGIGALCVGAAASVVFFGICYMENKKRDRGDRDHLFQLPEDELQMLGDRHPAFRYCY